MDPSANEHWRTLTADREKVRAYARDEAFTSGLAHARDVLGDDVGRLVQRHTALVLQPDCVVARAAGRCVDHLRRHGFEPIHTVRFRFDADLTSGVWRYETAASTRACLDIADLVCGRSDSLLVLLRDTTPDVLAAHVEALYAESEAHDLDLDAAWSRLTGLITDPDLLAALDGVRRGAEKLDWGGFVRDLAGLGIDPLGWDPLVIGSAHVQLDLDEVPRLLDRVSVGSWLAGDGVLLT